MALSYLVAFCRLVLALVFLASFVGKVRDPRGFARTIAAFAPVGGAPAGTAAATILVGEAITALLLVVGGTWTLAGFVAAGALLVLFTIVLATALVRGLAVPCNCFGTSPVTASHADVWRNVGLLACAVAGIAILGAIGREVPPPAASAWLILGVAAVGTIALWGSIVSVIRLARRPPRLGT